MRLASLEIHRTNPSSPLMQRLALLMARHQIKHVIDVGANVGQFASELRSMGFRGRIDSYEPGRGAFRSLRAASMDDPNWHAHNVGLSSSSGTADLRQHDDSSLNSLAPLTEAGLKLFQSIGSHENGARESVTLTRLDDAHVPDLGPLLLKLDTQGHDFEAIDGAPATIERCPLLLIELAFIPLYASTVPAPEALGRLDLMGFAMVDLFPISREQPADLAIVEADALFCRK